MDLLSGLEQFGIYAEQDDMEIYADEKRKAGSVKKQETKEDKKVLTEVDYLFTKKINCTICDREIYVRMVKGTKLKRMQPDFDLRPRFEGIDALKYDVFACPYCGYAAMGRYFDHLTRGQIQLVKDNVCANFRYASDDLPDVYTYEETVTRYKLALYSSIVKRARTSEKAYTCLKLAWLYREMEQGESGKDAALKAEYKKLWERFYKEAYDGFQHAIVNEDFPMCGMDTYTMDYLLAALGYYFKDYSYASRCISHILSSRTVGRRIKDKALDLKEIIIADIKKSVANAAKK